MSDWSSGSILKKLPDFDDMMNVSSEIGDLLLDKLKLETSIKSAEADTILKVSTEEKYFVGGKPPSMSFAENTYKVTGLAGELIPMREKLAEITANLEKKKIQYDVYKNMLDMWRTLAANERYQSV